MNDTHEPFVDVVVQEYHGAPVGSIVVRCDCGWSKVLGPVPRTAAVHIEGMSHRLDQGIWP